MIVVGIVVVVLGLVLLLHGLRGLVLAEAWQAQVGGGLTAIVGMLLLVAGLLGLGGAS